MNKKLIAIAVVAAMAPAAAMAEATVYGRIHASIDSVSGIAAEKNNLSVNDNSSRFGVKGSQALDGGLTALYQIESGVNANGTQAGGTFPGVRDTYIGLTGSYGTFLTGRLPAANQYVYDSNMFADQLGDASNNRRQVGRFIDFATDGRDGLRAPKRPRRQHVGGIGFDQQPLAGNAKNGLTRPDFGLVEHIASEGKIGAHVS